MEALRQNPEVQMLQIAHDLKSPLTALEIIAARLKTLPPDERQLIIQAVDRIQEIMVGVLSPTPAGSAPSLQKMWGLDNLRGLIDEKQFEFPQIRFQVEITADGAFTSKIPAAQMNRVVSNLMNNACEANGGSGVVCIRVRTGEEFAIEIEDEGQGVPAEIREHLGQLGVSGKDSTGARRGIGLYSAFQFVNELGGRLQLEDRLNERGTRVRLDLTAADKIRPARAV